MAGKRGNGEGTIVPWHRTNKTGERYQAGWKTTVSLPGGKRKWLYAKNRQAVAQKLAATTPDRDKGALVNTDERQTVEHYLNSWLQMCKPNLKPSTRKRYSEYVRLHANPTLGNVLLVRLSPKHIQHLYATKLSEGLSQTTVHHIHAALHYALDQAFR
jgi:hypothetical protein